jgi:hypothetical protein
MVCSKRRGLSYPVETDGIQLTDTITVAGDRWAMAITICGPARCIQLITISSFPLPPGTTSDLGGGDAVSDAQPHAFPTGNEAQVFSLRLRPNRAAAWMVCAVNATPGVSETTPRACLRDSRRRWIYAFSASHPSPTPVLVAFGRHISARSLRLSADGRVVRWRQGGRHKRLDIGP